MLFYKLIMFLFLTGCNKIADMFAELLLAPDDLKRLHEFEEKCVAGYFRDQKESQQGSQINRIRSAADK